MKLARNLVHFVSFTAVTEAQRLAEASGIDLNALGEVVRHTDAITGGPGAIMYRDTTAPLDTDDFWHGVFTHVAALGEKDLGFAIVLADQLGIDVPLARLALTDLAPGLGLTGERPGPTRSASVGWTRWPRSTAGSSRTGRVTSSATPPTTSSPTSGPGPASPTGTAGCC
jgi:hypothetical protein